MKFYNAFALGLCLVGAAFAADAAAPTKTLKLYDGCRSALDAAKSQVSSNALNAKLTVLDAEAVAFDLQAAESADTSSSKTIGLAAACSLYVKIINVESETQNIRNHMSENWEKRMATNRSIEAIQEQISNARSGKVSSLSADLEAEKARLAQTSEAMKEQEARLQAEMQQDREKFQADAAEKEAALKAAAEREAELKNREAELKQREAELQQQLEAEKKALAEERAKAEARQQEAMNKLNELQSKLIQVSKDARGIILSMSDILFDVNKATLKQDLKTSLAKVAGILSVYQQFNVSIEGNTDNTGSEEHNMKLSQQRADNVMNFLVEQGIDAGRLTAKGLGMTMPIADNSTKEGRQKNRRVDLVIQDKALLQAEPENTTAVPAEPSTPEVK